MCICLMDVLKRKNRRHFITKGKGNGPYIGRAGVRVNP